MLHFEAWPVYKSVIWFVLQLLNDYFYVQVITVLSFADKFVCMPMYWELLSYMS